MRRPGYRIVRILALLAVIASSFAVFGSPVTAAPDTAGSGEAALYQGTGTATASAYICNGLDQVVWGGSPDANCSPASATFVFYLIGDGTDDSWSLPVNGTGSISLTAGSYEVWENVSWTMSTVNVPAGGNASITVLYPGDPLPPPPPPPVQTGTVSVSAYECNGLDQVVWGGSPDGNCSPTAATFYFYLIGDGTDDYWTLSVNGTNSRSLTAGTYEAYEGIYWSMGSVTINAGQTTSVSVLFPGDPLPPPPPATGTVTMNKYICNGVSTVTWGGSPDGNCSPSTATFYFYLIGDGTDEFWTLNVNGSGSRTLQAGTYEVYEGSTWSKSTVTVTAGQTTTVNVLNPGAPLPPPEGTVSLSKYICDGQTGVIWGGTPNANCRASKATFYFYLIGDGTDDFWALNVNGTGSRTLPAGTYEVWESTTWSMHTMTVTAGQTTSLNVLNPGKPLPPMGTVEINKYVCDDVTQVTWGGTPSVNCDPGAATFYFYLIGDGTDQYWALDVNGTGSLTLKAGTYEVWEDGTWSMQRITVVADDTVVVNVRNPAD